MAVKIAFCGPNRDLNEGLARIVKDLTYSDTIDYVELPPPMHRVLELTRREDFKEHDLDWLNMWSVSLRRMALEGARGDIITSASCGIDEVCLQAAYVGEQIEHAKVGLTLVDQSGNPLIAEEAVWINRSSAVLQSILNSAEEEVHSIWDFIYAVMPVEDSMSPANESLLFQYRDLLDGVPAFQIITHLPDNEAAAVDALKNEVGKWTEILRAS